MEEKKIDKKIKKKNKIPVWAIVLIVLAIIGVIIYFLCIFGFLGLTIFNEVKNSDIEFSKKDDKTYYSDQISTTIEEIDAEYDETDACYVITLKVEKDGKVDKNFLSNDELDISYKLYDSEGYLLGTADGNAGDFSEENKWKVKVQYCESDADEVSSYKLTNIATY